ncbi:MAG: hypothetical protein HY323_07070 [Betaproteobacteria bacterium]|nr:hypothetical protein [Betaproteobacteria bacterium]
MNSHEREVFEQLYAACDELAEDCRWRTLDAAMLAARVELDKCEWCCGKKELRTLIRTNPPGTRWQILPCSICNGTGKHKDAP